MVPQVATIYVIRRSLNQSLTLHKITSLAGIYVHIPFCRKACHYCDFHFSTSMKLADDMVDAIVLEAQAMKDYLKTPIETIYFGGGTPSVLSYRQLSKIMKAIEKHFHINSSVEFTLEANPDDLKKETLKELASLGVNRLSIGTQSFDDTILKQLNRSHSAKQALEAVENARAIGINNISLDLIYGIPNQHFDLWKNNLDELTELNPNHISCYALTIEEKTVFGKWKEKGRLTPKEDKQVAEEYDYMIEFLNNKGFEQYEVSNLAQPGFESKHNSSYWRQKPYLGLGPGAHSFNGQERHFTIANNPKYIKGIAEGISISTTEVLNQNEQITEYILTRIRTKWGVDFNQLNKQFSYTLTNNQHQFIQSVVDQKLATFVENKLVLNTNGFFISDSIALELIPDP